MEPLYATLDKTLSPRAFNLNPVKDAETSNSININDKDPLELTPLLELPKSPALKLFECAVRKGVLTSEGKFIGQATPILPNLKGSALERFEQALNNLGIPGALLHICDSIAKLGFNPDKAFKIVGSSVPWMLKEYIAERFDEAADIKGNKAGLNLLSFFGKEALSDSFNCPPADIDIRVVLGGADKSQLKLIGKEIAEYLINEGYQVENAATWRNPIEVCNNRCYKLTVRRGKKVADIIFVGELYMKYLTAADAAYIPLSTSNLKILKAVAVKEPDRSINEISAAPRAFAHECERAFYLGTMKRLVADELGKIDMRGAIKFINALTEGKLPLSLDVPTKLVGDFINKLAHGAPGEAMEEVRRAVDSHFLCSAALTGVRFNIFRLLHRHDADLFFRDTVRLKRRGSGCLLPLEMQNSLREMAAVTKERREEKLTEFRKMLFAPARQRPKHQIDLPLSTPMEALHSLMEADDFPYEVLSAYLLVLAYHTAARSTAGQKNPLISVFADKLADENVTLMTWNKEGITLLLSNELAPALKILNKYFRGPHQAYNYGKKLQALSEPFFKDIESAIPNACSYGNCPKDDHEKLFQIAVEAEGLLQIKELKVAGFLLLCQCGQSLGISQYLPILCGHLLQILTETESAQQRVAVLRQFLQYFRGCNPADGLFQKPDKLEGLIKLLGIPYNSREERLLECCRTLAYSHNAFIAAEILSSIKEQPDITFVSHAKEMIAKYLSIQPQAPTLALRVLERLAVNKRVIYADLAVCLRSVYSRYDARRLSQDLDRFAIVAMQLLKIKSGGEGSDPGDEVVIELIDMMVKMDLFDAALDLINEADKKGIYKGRHKILYNRRISNFKYYIKRNQWEKAFNEWFKANLLYLTSFPESNSANELIEPLLSINPNGLTPEDSKAWRVLLLKGPIEKLSQETCQKLIVCLANAHAHDISECNPKGAFQSKGEWLLQQVEVYCSKEKKSDLCKNLKVYFSIANNPSEGCGIAEKGLLGAYCFKSFISCLHGGNENSHKLENEIVEAAKEMLASTSGSEQINGFSILCGLDKSMADKALLSLLIGALPTILTSDEPLVHRLRIYQQFFNYLACRFPDFIDPMRLNKLKHELEAQSTNDVICHAFCEAFSHAAPELIFEPIHIAWQKIEAGSAVTAVLLIDKFIKNYPAFAIKVLSGQIKRGGLQILKIKEYWNRLQQDNNTELLTDLFEIAKFLMAKIGNDRSRFAFDLFKLIGKLISAGQSESSLFLFEQAESKKYFVKVNDFEFDIWLQICQQYRLKNKSKAVSVCEHLLGGKEKDLALKLLLEWWNSEPDERLIEVTFQGLSMSTRPEIEFGLACSIVNYFCSMDKIGKISTDFQKKLQANAGRLASILKLFIERSEMGSKSAFSNLLQLLFKYNLEPFSIIDKEKLWSIFLKEFALPSGFGAELSWIIPQLASTADKSGKCSLEDKSKVFLCLAEAYIGIDVDLGVKCLERGIMASSRELSSADSVLALITAYINTLIRLDRLSMAKELMVNIEKVQTNLSAEGYFESWKAILLGANEKNPGLAANILLAKYSLFGAPEIQSIINPIANSACLYLISLNTPLGLSQALKIAKSFPVTDAFFWREALPHITEQTLNAKAVFEWLSNLEEPFTGSSADCQNCWLLWMKLIVNQKKCFLAIAHRYKYVANMFASNPSHLKTISLLFLEGLSNLRTDNSFDPRRDYEITDLLSEVYNICVNQYLCDELVSIELKLGFWRISLQNSQDMLTVLEYFKARTLDSKSLHYNQYICLLQKLIELSLALGFDWNSGHGQELLKIIDIHSKYLNSSTIVPVYVTQKTVGCFERAVDIILAEGTQSFGKYEQFQKEILSLSVEYLLKWLSEADKMKKFDLLLAVIEESKLLPILRLHYWHAVGLKRKLLLARGLDSNANITVVEDPRLTLSSYCKELPKILLGGDEALHCHQEVAKLFLICR